MHKRYPVQLTEAERDHLKRLIAAGTAPARQLIHARILLKADQSPEGAGWVDERIAEAVEVSQPTVARGRRQSVEQGLRAALGCSPVTPSALPAVPPPRGASSLHRHGPTRPSRP